MPGILSHTYKFIVLLRCNIHKIIIYRILRSILVANFVVEMGAGRLSRITDGSDHITTPDHITGSYIKLT